MAFVNMGRHVTRFTLLTYVKTVKPAKKDIVIRDIRSDVTILIDTTDATLVIFVDTFMQKPKNKS